MPPCRSATAGWLWRAPILLTVLYGVARIAMALLTQVRDGLFAKVAMHAVRRAGDLTGLDVMVNGAGPIGSLVVAAARHAGARSVTAADVNPDALAVAAAGSPAGARRVWSSSPASQPAVIVRRASTEVMRRRKGAS